MYAKNIISLYKILEEEPKTPTEAENREKDIKKYEKLVDNWIKKHSKKIKRIEKLFSNCQSLRGIFNRVFTCVPDENLKKIGGANVTNRPTCSKEAERGIGILFNAFKDDSKKLSKVLKKKLLDFELKEKDICDIFDGFDALADVVSFDKADMLKAINLISKLMKQSEGDLNKEYKILENHIDDCLKNLESNDEDFRSDFLAHMSGIQNDAYGKLKNVSFNKLMESLADVDNPGITRDYSMNKVLKLLNDHANHTVQRAHFRAMLDRFCYESNGNFKDSVIKKIQKLYEASRKKLAENIIIWKEKINKEADDFISKKSNEKPQLTNRPLPTPPVRGKSSSDVPKKPLPTPQKNSGDKKNRGSKYLSEEEIQRLESALKNGPNSKKKSVQTSDGTPSSNDKSKNLEIPNDESKEPSVSSDKSKKSKKRRSGLFRKHPKDDNATNDKSEDLKNPNNKTRKSWRKSLKKRLSGSFGRPSKTSNDTSTSSSNDAHQEELKKAVKRYSQRINPDEIPTES